MAWRELDRSPIIGELNTHFFVTDDHDMVFLKRIPKDNVALIDAIKKEYTETRFLPLGGSFRRRSLEEQIHFATVAAALGLRVLPSHITEDGVAYYPYLEGARSMQEYFCSSNASGSIVDQLFNDLHRAHTQGVIYGDRWLPNILVTKEGEVIHIDFDIEIFGAHAIEFEVAQVIYYTLLAGKDRVASDVITNIGHKPWFDPSMVAIFLNASAQYFKSSKYGGIEHLVTSVLSECGCQSTLVVPEEIHVSTHLT